MRRLPPAALLGLIALATGALLPACLPTATVPPANAEWRARQEVEAAEMYEGSEAAGAPAARGVALNEVLALRPKLAAPDRDEADRWIATHVAQFGELYKVLPVQTGQAAGAAAAAAKVAVESPLRQAERRFARWTAETRYDRRSPDFARALFLLPADALPGLDRFAMGIEAIETGDPGALAFFVYCGKSRELSERLVSWVASRHDPALALRVFVAALARDPKDECAHLPWSAGRPVPEFIRLWNASLWWPELWAAGARALIASRIDLDDPAAVSLIHQAWIFWPQQRGEVLHVIGEAARISGTFRGTEAGATFAQKIGPRPVKSDVMAMVALGPQTLPALAQIWRVRADPMSPSALAKQIARSAGPSGTGDRDPAQKSALVSLATDMCRDHQPGATQTMRSALRLTGLEDLLVPRTIAARCRGADVDPIPQDRYRTPGC